MHPPKKLQGILWSTDVNKLDIKQDKGYIIHQTLAYGRIEHIKWLFDMYSTNTIRNTFVTIPYKDYRTARFYLIKNHLLHIPDAMEEKRYVKNTPRDIRHKQA